MVVTLSQLSVAQDINLEDVVNYRYYPQTPHNIDAIVGKNIAIDELVASNIRPIYRRSALSNYTWKGKWQIKDAECPLVSPDKSMLAYVKENNIYLLDEKEGNTIQITCDGKFNHVINGKPDWVYEEEFEFNRAFDFSKDGRYIAWIRFDESAVKTYSFPWYKGLSPEKKDYALYTGNYAYKYPKAGEINSTVSVMSYDIKAGITTTMHVPLDPDGYIPRIKFTDDAGQLAVMTLNRLQNHFSIYLVNTQDGTSHLCYEAYADKYFDTNLYNNIDFTNNQFVLEEDKDGWNHLYLYDMNGRQIKQLTKGNWEVTNYLGREGNMFYYASNEGSPLEQYVYSITLGGKKTCLTKGKGFHKVTFGPNHSAWVDEYSSITTPSVFTLHKSDGSMEVLVDNSELKSIYKQFGKAELVTFTTSNGITMNGWMVYPKQFDKKQKYPVLMYQYSGPGSQEVHNSWNNGFFDGLIWEHRLAEKGYIVVCVDGRGTGGRGSSWKKCTYGRLYEKEADDQVSAAQYFASLPYIDKDRIAIWGWSFGGGCTLMSMSQGTPVFRCGVAVAPVTSNRYYDSVYTERYMGLPSQNKEGYDISAINKVKNLHGDLLLIHGFADDNVHFQQMAEYTEALVQEGIQFESQFYVNRNHSIFGGNTRLHLFTRIENFLDAHLLKVSSNK